MTTSDSGTWNPESFDQGLTECVTCGTRTTGGAGIDPSSLRRLVHDEIRRYREGGAADEAEPVSPVVEGDGSGGEGCEAPGRSEGLDVEAVEAARREWRSTPYYITEDSFPLSKRLINDDIPALIAEVRRLESEVDARARSVIAANGRTERVEAALVRMRGERDSAVIRGDQWQADAGIVTKDRDYLRKFLDETVRERDEARTALAVAKAQAESEAVARAEAEAERDALPEKIAAKIEGLYLRGGVAESGYALGLQDAAWTAVRAARSFTAEPSMGRMNGAGVGSLKRDGQTGADAHREQAETSESSDESALHSCAVHSHPVTVAAEPVPEPVREWGVRHKGCDVDVLSEREARRESRYDCCVLVSRVPGGEWEAAE